MINVVVAYQAPTLFNRLALSDRWSMRMAPLGDHAGLSELSQMKVPTWSADVDPAPELVIVCSPAQFETAERMWPAAKIVWAVHNGYERWLLPPEYDARVAGAICFSERVRWLQETGRKARHYFVSPAYDVEPKWTWVPNSLWSLRNRPGSRRDDIDLVVAAVTAGLNHACFGQDQPLGVADETLKDALTQRCSGYVSAMPRGAGFGLAEHEALAAGVPVIGDWWGDFPEEMPQSYWGLQHRLLDMRDAALRVCVDDHGAAELSALGMQYIRAHRTVVRMNDTISDMLEDIV